MNEVYVRPPVQNMPKLVMSAEQRMWLQDSRDEQQDERSMSPKVMYPRLLGRPAIEREPKRVSVSEISASGYLERPPQNLSTEYASSAGQMEEVEYSEPSADLGALMSFLDELILHGARLTEVTYIVNNWKLGGIIPLKHHGFVFKAEGHGFLTLDFNRRGILWDTFEEYPDYPEGTIFARRHRIDFDPEQLKVYCEETKPFSWPGNDCTKWSQGLLRVVRVRDHVEEAGWMYQCSCMDNCGSVDSIVQSHRSAI